MRVRRLALALAASLAPWPRRRPGRFSTTTRRVARSELRTQTGERLDTQSRAQLDLANQIESLKGEVARLRGQVESPDLRAGNGEEAAAGFLRRPGRAPAQNRTGKQPAAAPAAAGAAGKPAGDAAEVRKPADPAEEAKATKRHSTSSRPAKYKESAAAFAAFVKNHPDSDLAPSAQYWQGNSHYGLRDCKKAIEAQKVVVARWGDHPKAPDAMPTCPPVQELGDARAPSRRLKCWSPNPERFRSRLRQSAPEEEVSKAAACRQYASARFSIRCREKVRASDCRPSSSA